MGRRQFPRKKVWECVSSPGIKGGKASIPQEECFGNASAPQGDGVSLFSRERTGELGCQFTKERFVVAGFSTPGQELSLLSLDVRSWERKREVKNEDAFLYIRLL